MYKELFELYMYRIIFKLYIYIYTEETLLTLAKRNENQIVITIFRLILNQKRNSI